MKKKQVPTYTDLDRLLLLKCILKVVSRKLPIVPTMVSRPAPWTYGLSAMAIRPVHLIPNHQDLTDAYSL